MRSPPLVHCCLPVLWRLSCHILTNILVTGEAPSPSFLDFVSLEKLSLSPSQARSGKEPMPVLESVVDRETQLACQIHGHRVLLLRNLRAEAGL